MVSRYQAGEGIYEQFDKVMVLDQGRTVYFGPPDQARAYFERLGYRPLPRQSTADYLTGCTDPNERQFAPGVSENDVPNTPEALEAAFQNSDFARDVADQLSKYKLRMETEKIEQDAFRAAVADDKKKGVSIKSPYTLGLKDQVVALTRRQFQKRLQDKFQIYTSYTFMTVSDMPLPFARSIDYNRSRYSLSLLVAVTSTYPPHPLVHLLVAAYCSSRSLFHPLMPSSRSVARFMLSHSQKLMFMSDASADDGSPSYQKADGLWFLSSSSLPDCQRPCGHSILIDANSDIRHHNLLHGSP